MDQQLSQEQKQQVKKAKRVLWIGIVGIIVIGLAIAVYFVFIQEGDKGDANTNVNSVNGNSNVVINSNVTNDISGWQTYEDVVNGYSMKYPADYLIKMETDGYVVFDPTFIDSPDTSYLHVSVNVANNDFHTYRLGVLTNPSVDTGSPIDEVDVTMSGLSGKKITLKNALGETIIHYLVAYLGKVYDISAGDSVDAKVLNNIISSFEIYQLSDRVDIADTDYFFGRECVSNNDCGAFPCVDGACLVQECMSDDDCSNGSCGQYVTPVPGYCTTMDSL